MVDDFIKKTGGYWKPLGLFSALVEEIGEVAEIFRKISLGEEKYIDDLEIELGDVFFALICIANYYKIDLETALLKTLTKYKKRIK